jgi:uncharacterized protein
MARLEDYSFGRLTVDGQEHTRDLIVLPDRVVSDWWRPDPAVIAELERRGVQVECLSTNAAVRRYTDSDGDALTEEGVRAVPSSRRAAAYPAAATGAVD